jgi:hypothetical protein
MVMVEIHGGVPGGRREKAGKKGRCLKTSTSHVAIIGLSLMRNHDRRAPEKWEAEEAKERPGI